MKDERGKEEMGEPDEDEQEIYMDSPTRSRGCVRAKLWRSVSSLATLPRLVFVRNNLYIVCVVVSAVDTKVSTETFPAP